MLTKEQKQDCIDKVKIREDDTGSAFVQISILTKKIDTLNKHLSTNHKDNHSKKGLLKMIGVRRKLISYLKKNDLEKFNGVAGKLGLKIK